MFLACRNREGFRFAGSTRTTLSRRDFVLQPGVSEPREEGIKCTNSERVSVLRLGEPNCKGATPWGLRGPRVNPFGIGCGSAALGHSAMLAPPTDRRRHSANLRLGLPKQQLDPAERARLFSTGTLPHSKSPSFEPPTSLVLRGALPRDRNSDLGFRRDRKHIP